MNKYRKQTAERRSRPVLALSRPGKADNELREAIAQRADEIYQMRGGLLIEQMQNTIGLVLQDFTNQMRLRVEAGSDLKPLVTPYVAMRYMKENRKLETERQELLDECLEQAQQELDPQPVDLTEAELAIEDMAERIVKQAMADTAEMSSDDPDSPAKRPTHAVVSDTTPNSVLFNVTDEPAIPEANQTQPNPTSSTATG
ncbi:MAG: hypothetical protein ACYTDT_10125 [Planctomycetota bacterium]